MKNIQSYSIINDAVHKVMSFPEDCKDLIKLIVDSQTFQRLRHIKQLGMTELIFPTAVHNRFSHCLGASYVAYQMATNLGLRERETKYAIVSVLLHDIGHGPFSHAFEKILISKKGVKIKHEDWTESFLKEFEEGLEKHHVDYRILAQLIQRNYDYENRTYNIVADITSSQLDADRLDYLLRDSHFCGVPYGSTDISWIIKHLTIVNDEEGLPRLGVLQKGWRAVEHFLLCRRIMAQNVFKHHKKNAIEKLLHEFLIRIADGLADQESTIEGMIPRGPLKEFLKNTVAFRNDETDKQQFVSHNFPYYKHMTDYDIWTLIRDFAHEAPHNPASVFQIAHRIYNRNLPFSFKFPDSYGQEVMAAIQEIKDICSLRDCGWQIFTTDSDVTVYETHEDPILIVDEWGTTLSLTHYSDLMTHFTDCREQESYIAIDQEIWMSHGETIKGKLEAWVSFPKNVDG